MHAARQIAASVAIVMRCARIAENPGIDAMCQFET
jgi:hypothetical protein